MKNKNGFSPTGWGNEVLGCDGFYISYRSSRILFSVFENYKGGPETALIKDDRHYILNGDFREIYKELNEIGGWERCIKFFKAHPSFKSRWSNDL